MIMSKEYVVKELTSDEIDRMPTSAQEWSANCKIYNPHTHAWCYGVKQDENGNENQFVADEDGNTIPIL